MKDRASIGVPVAGHAVRVRKKDESLQLRFSLQHWSVEFGMELPFAAAGS